MFRVDDIFFRIGEPLSQASQSLPPLAPAYAGAPAEHVPEALPLAPVLETVSRLFSRFHQEGLIHVQGRGVKLIDPVAIKRIGQRP